MKFMDILLERNNLPGGGDCFDSAYNYMMKNGFGNHELRLVHGFVSGRGKLDGYRFTHAWCEDDENVYDNANNRTIKIPKVIYYGMGNVVPDECKYYNIEDVVRKSSKYKHKGPWDIKNEVKKEIWNR